MALAPDPNNIILGKGELFFDRFSAAGARQGYFHLGNCQRFAIILNDDILSLNTSQDAAGGLLKRVTKSRVVNIEIGSNEFGIENLALALMGDQGTFTQALTTPTNTLTTNAQKGRYFKAAHRGISSVVLTQGTVTLAPSTDYTVYDSSAGLIFFPATSNVTTGTNVTAVYVAATLSLLQILGATKTKIEGSLLFVPDPTTGPQFDVEVWKCSVSPGGEVGLITDDFGEYQLNLSALDDSAGVYGGSSTMPYFRKIQRGTA